MGYGRRGWCRRSWRNRRRRRSIRTGHESRSKVDEVVRQVLSTKASGQRLTTWFDGVVQTHLGIPDLPRDLVPKTFTLSANSYATFHHLSCRGEFDHGNSLYGYKGFFAYPLKHVAIPELERPCGGDKEKFVGNFVRRRGDERRG